MPRFFAAIFILHSLLFSSTLLYCQKKTQVAIGGDGKINPKPPITRILFVFDDSYSMMGQWDSDLKINTARKVLIGMIDSLRNVENVQMALRVYGHQSQVPPQDCSDTRLEVPFSRNNASVIRQKLRYITPKGTTPIAYSLQQAGDDFPPCADCRNIIILISDGLEECGGDPCKVSDELQKKGIILKPFIIGIGVDENFAESFNCIGHFYNAEHEENFKDLLDVVITQALNSTTAQINLLDEKGEPTETNVNMTFYNLLTGKVMHNYVHTINNRGNPDTLLLDPLVAYKLVVHTIPSVGVDSFRVTPGKHTIVAIDAPQGNLLVTSPGLGNLYRDLICLVKKTNECTTLNVQYFNEPVKYLTGKYDIEIPILPRIILKNVEIKQSTTTTIDIPRPGFLTVSTNSPGYGSLYLKRSEKMEWIYNLNANNRKESIVLQPGTYQIVYRSANSKQCIYTTNRTVEIKSGSTLTIDLY
jgi:Ca-activated chloride channel family protein